ncbi:MAG: HlyD family efflux transporter periplasmic adaptor subunit [Verrucomicrobiota bacterium]|nr:HlyD family efflux transporter periplasmic adaptor subunit [Verrucomicrobiota bacterium]
MSNNKQPIPIPTEQRLQDFRQVLLPIIVFSICVIGLGLLWWNKIAPSSVVGEARSDNIVISSPRAGLLKEVHVGRFDEIKAGEPIAEVDYSTDPNYVDAQVEWVRAQVNLLTLTIDPVQRARTTLNYNQLRLDWLNERTTLAALKIEFENSEREYQRVSKLFNDQLVSDSVYNKAKTDRDSYKVKVEETTGLVSSIEQALREAQDTDPASFLDKVRIEKLDQSLARVEELLNPIILSSPIDGKIGSISKQTGESVRDGETIATISSSKVKKVVGYIPQPINFEPKVGDVVEVRTRRLNGKQVIKAKISKVSNRLEAVGSEVLRDRAAYRKVLPFTVDLKSADTDDEQSLNLHPGELVDIHFINK